MSIALGFIGGGIMAEALLSRLIAQEVYPGNKIVVSEPRQERQDFLQEKYGVKVTSDNTKVFQEAETVLLAIKPQVFDRVVQELNQNINQNINQKGKEPLVISILAGMPLSRLEAGFPGCGVIRVMPNAPATVGAGMTALAPGKGIISQQIEQAKTIFSSVGQVVEVPESLMDAVTGLSGSGPAFVALMIEALSDGGVKAGLPRNIATQLATQTVLGTAVLVQETDIHPAQLKDRVTSPGGTTIAGVAELEKNGFRSAVIEAVSAAYQRSQALGRNTQREI